MRQGDSTSTRKTADNRSVPQRSGSKFHVGLTTLLIILPSIVFADQVAKALAQVVLADGRVVKIGPGLNFILGYNRGVSFGLFPAGDPYGVALLIGVTIIMIGILIAWTLRATNTVERIGLTLITGGAVGNLIDRIRNGAVTDFIDLYIRDWHWPTFNVADISITIGAALLILGSWPSTQTSRRPDVG